MAFVFLTNERTNTRVRFHTRSRICTSGTGSNVQDISKPVFAKVRHGVTAAGLGMAQFCISSEWKRPSRFLWSQMHTLHGKAKKLCTSYNEEMSYLRNFNTHFLAEKRRLYLAAHYIQVPNDSRCITQKFLKTAGKQGSALQLETHL